MTSAIDPFAPEQIILAANEQITIRLLEPKDAPQLFYYFNNLSIQTKRYFAPHSFDLKTVTNICATLNPTECVRLVATSSIDQRIIAYTLLLYGITASDKARFKPIGIDLTSETDCSFAPSIADTYQSQGLGGRILQKMLRIARMMSKKRVILWGGVQASNERAVRYYQKHGFVKMADFDRNGLNYAMCLHID